MPYTKSYDELLDTMTRLEKKIDALLVEELGLAEFTSRYFGEPKVVKAREVVAKPVPQEESTIKPPTVLPEGATVTPVPVPEKAMSTLEPPKVVPSPTAPTPAVPPRPRPKAES